MSKEEIRDMVFARFRSSPLASDYFPVRMRNGVIVRGFKARCSNCNEVIVRGSVRGELRTAPAGCFRVTALGHCQNCNFLDSFLFHLIPEGTDDYRVVNLAKRGWLEECVPVVIKFPGLDAISDGMVEWGEHVTFLVDNATPSG